MSGGFQNTVFDANYVSPQVPTQSPDGRMYTHYERQILQNRLMQRNPSLLDILGPRPGRDLTPQPNLSPLPTQTQVAQTNQGARKK
jgi:hypothetical protein